MILVFIQIILKSKKLNIDEQYEAIIRVLATDYDDEAEYTFLNSLLNPNSISSSVIQDSSF